MTVRLNPYIVLNGNAREAIAFYERALDAKVVAVQTFGDMPDPSLPAGLKEQVAHARLSVGETDLMFSDTFPGSPYQTGNHLNVLLTTDDAARSRRLFAALAEGGRITMPIRATHWSPAYGQEVDRFGVVWQVTTEGQAESAGACEKRAGLWRPARFVL